MIASLEAWFDYRWGKKGKSHPGLLECFNRFPSDDGLTPDFEVRFHTPYVIWGECKRELNPKFPGDIEQVLKYSMRAEKYKGHGYDVVVLVRPENQTHAAKAIAEARTVLLDAHRSREEARFEKERKDVVGATPRKMIEDISPPTPITELPLAPIIVLAYYRDPESVNNEWYLVYWHPDSNSKFSSPNVFLDSAGENLNKLLCDQTHHSIPVNKSALERTGRNPFINDTPPPLYTALRLVVPALAQLLTTDEAEELQANGKVEKIISRDDILNTQFCRSIQPQPGPIATWIDAAFNAMANDIGAAHAITNTSPTRYRIVIDSVLIKGDIKEIWSDRAALKAARQPGAKSGRRRKMRKRKYDDHPKFWE